MENVTVKNVEKNGAWYEVELEDGRKASTKNQDVADAAFASRGNEVPAVINSQVKGKFTNTYLNEIAGVSDGGKKRSGVSNGSGGGVSGSGIPERAPGRDQERIARQWAYGRSTELLIASGMDFTFPLDITDFQKLKAQADTLLEATK